MLEFVPGLLDRGPAAVAAARHALADLSAMLYERGWAFGTSGNYSALLSHEPLRLLITASGRDKRRLTDTDFTIVDERGRTVDAGAPRPSAETMLHVTLAQRGCVGSVLHTHSTWNTVLSDLHAARGALRIEGYEMLKGLTGVTTHESAIEIPIFENTQDIPDLALRVAARLDETGDGLPWAFLIRRHGLYTWGRDLAEARRHVEILEFLFEVVGRSSGL
ncbi:Methylthioribulose-1-phosphate dehydratase [Phycisphaerae bacterium RAS1]|nr:Methylthioribulose-1-phosphate dehydratase [Phycisphaerae bacterium RAS1]